MNASEMAWTGGLARGGEVGTPGERVYQSQCAMCHGGDRAGSPPAFPSLIGVLTRLSVEQVTDNVKNGNGRMPSFPNLDEPQLDALIDYLRTEPSAGRHPSPVAGAGVADSGAGDGPPCPADQGRSCRLPGSVLHLPRGPSWREILLDSHAHRIGQSAYRGPDRGADRKRARERCRRCPIVQGPDLDALLRYLEVSDKGLVPPNRDAAGAGMFSPATTSFSIRTAIRRLRRLGAR